MEEKKAKKKTMTYKNFPLVRSGQTICLGDPSEKYIAMLQILSTKEEDGINMADKIAIQIISTNTELPMQERIIKRSDKAGLYPALDIAAIWLEREISGKS